MTDLNYNDTIGRIATGSYQPVASVQSAVLQTTQAQQLSSASSYADLNYLFGVQDTTMIAPKPNRSRRKSSQGSEHTKHRRTRSGCYTCRSRRVKCDEAHPICERCKKGGRDCLYPESPTTSKSSGSGSSKTAKRESPGSSSDEYDEGAGPEPLEAIRDEDEDEDSHDVIPGPSILKLAPQRVINNPAFSGQKPTTRHSSEAPSLVQDGGNSPTPSTEGSVGYPAYQTAGSARTRIDWSHLPQDLQFYLAYFYQNLTHLHYSLKFDSGNFLRTRFLDAALRNEALLHAVVGFSAYQRTLHNPEGKINDFLQYYNKAVSLLLTSLRSGARHNTAMILAILQLATIEEFLGDWPNLLGHQKAAYELLTELYTPQTVMEDDMTRVMLGWYMRFDVFAGLMGGFETVLSREWFSYAHDFYRQQVANQPANLDWKIEHAIAKHRLIATDMSLLFAKMGKGEISPEEFVKDNGDIGRRIEEWKSKMDPALQDCRYLVADFSGSRPLDPDDIVDPYIAGTLYGGPLFVMNIATIDWYSIDLMHKYQTALTLRTQPNQELGMKAYATCQLFEAIEFYPRSPPGAVLSIQASLGMALLFLPRDLQHAMWARRKLATIETNGYIYPYTFRTKMADLFRDRSCMHWWLPNDEDYPPIIRSIRNFVEERTSEAKTLPAEDLRDMKAIFASLKLDDGIPSAPAPGVKSNSTIGIAVAATHDSYLGHDNLASMDPERDAYGLDFDNGLGF
ncbi:uncharacterized protein K444DRAFT_547199 [Hyaloscypha bicolor E]|uniref:Zn(2)-C6 fungal-type domain-containing protein n=1 Tax=Hyaloscypha bicolor E TaxID=1095630 RepID=A0A2J6SHU4_9HELO|nr:uncharacterized protein K444DRAFT_547199 [Hyaloscypha bicolor E]PMD50290.1 hypothetical protein K444DRAFT_547199 [Hyaloscypha bicolor E]